MRKYLRGSRTLLDDGTFAFVASTRQQVQLPVPATFIKRLWLNLRGTLTITGVTVPGLPHLDGAANLLQKIELYIDGEQVKFGMGPHFLRLAQKYFQTAGVNTGILSGAAGVYAFNAQIPLMFEMPSSRGGGIETIEDGRLIRNMLLAVTWGTTADLIVGNTSTLALTNTSIQVYCEDTDPNFVRQGQLYRFREYETSLLNVGTSDSTGFPIDPPALGSVIRSILLKSVDGTNLSDAVINTLAKLQINGNNKIPFDTIEDDFFQGLSLYDFGIDVMPDGYYLLEMAEQPKNALVVSTGLGARGGEIKTMKVVLGTTVGAAGQAATSVIAHISELVPRKAA